MVPHGFREFAQRFSHAETDRGKRELNAGPTTFGYLWLFLILWVFFCFCKWFRTDSVNSRSVPMRKLTAASANSTLARRRLVIFVYFCFFLVL